MLKTASSARAGGRLVEPTQRKAIGKTRPCKCGLGCGTSSRRPTGSEALFRTFSRPNSPNGGCEWPCSTPSRREVGRRAPSSANIGVSSWRCPRQSGGISCEESPSGLLLSVRRTSTRKWRWRSSSAVPASRRPRNNEAAGRCGNCPEARIELSHSFVSAGGIEVPADGPPPEKQPYDGIPCSRSETSG